MTPKEKELKELYDFLSDYCNKYFIDSMKINFTGSIISNITKNITYSCTSKIKDITEEDKRVIINNRLNE